jgi:hypothetical protein
MRLVVWDGPGAVANLSLILVTSAEAGAQRFGTGL